MKRLALAFLITLAFGLPGCNCGPATANIRRPRDMARPRDLTASVPLDLRGASGDALNACGSLDPSCTVTSVGPAGTPSMPFPLPSDNPPPDNVTGDGVGRDTMGYLILDSTRSEEHTSELQSLRH